jgi:hypothetical protein
LDGAEDEYQQHFDDAWTRYRPVDWEADPPRAARAGRESAERQIRDGLSERQDLLADNPRHLDDALAEVEAALRVRVGDATASAHAEATRLKGVVLYHMGLRERIRASQKRAEAGPVRRDLAAVGAAATARQAETTLADDSGISERIAELQEAAASAERVLEEDRKALAAIRSDVTSIEKRVNDARSRSAQARSELERLKAQGLDYSNPDASESFAQAFRNRNEVYRQSEREARGLESGDYVSADIDFSGDFVTGEYVDVESGGKPAVRHGLAYYRNQLTVASTRLTLHQDSLDGFRAGIARLEGMSDSTRATQERAINAVTELGSASDDIYAKLNRIESEAFALEEAALGLLERSMRASIDAARGLREWVSSGDGPASGKRREAQWLVGYVKAQEADARLVRAWIMADRFAAHSETASVIEGLPEPVRPDEADQDQERTKAVEAHDAGVREVTEAMTLLERVHGDVGNHWTISAQAAGTVYVLALLGHEDYAADAAVAYRLAITGREDKSYAAAFVSRLKKLENR